MLLNLIVIVYLIVNKKRIKGMFRRGLKGNAFLVFKQNQRGFRVYNYTKKSLFKLNNTINNVRSRNIRINKFSTTISKNVNESLVVIDKPMRSLNCFFNVFKESKR